jgi:hypothetical protein
MIGITTRYNRETMIKPARYGVEENIVRAILIHDEKAENGWKALSFLFQILVACTYSGETMLPLGLLLPVGQSFLESMFPCEA